MLSEYPFHLIIKNTYSEGHEESLLCKELLRSLPGKRKVFDAVWNNRDVIVKIFSDRFKAKRHLKREWKGLRILSKRKINSPEPLFFGHTKNNHWAIVTEKIDKSSSALELFYKSANSQDKLDLLLKISHQLAVQHIHGILQKDLHLGNFLLQDKKVFLIDAAKIQFQDTEIGYRNSISQLAMLAAWLPENQTNSIKRICRQYFNTRGWTFRKLDDFTFQKTLRTQRKRTLRKGLKKCLRTNKRHLKIKDKKYIAEFNRDFCNESEMNNLIAKVDYLIEAGQIIKDGKTSAVSHLHWTGKNIVIKRYNHIGIIHSLRHTIKRSRACRCWLHGHRLEMLDISTPKPLAYIEQKRAFLIWKSYLITEFINGTNLTTFLKNKNNSQTDRSRVVQKVLETLEKLWNYRITHGDLKHTNILIINNNPVLTDLDAMIIHRWNFLYKSSHEKDILRFFQDKESLADLSINSYIPFLEKDHPIQNSQEDFDNINEDDWKISINKILPLEIMKKLLKMNNLSDDTNVPFHKVPSSNYAYVYTTSIHLNDSDFNVYIKKYLYRSAIDFIKHIFRSSRARREFNASIMLNKNNFNTPIILGLAERRFSLLNRDNLLITKEIKDAKPIPKLMKDIYISENSLSRKRSLIKAFALTIGKMHFKHIFHGDLRLGNVLVAEEDNAWKFYFIDNERTKKHFLFAERLRLKNLVQINLFFDGISRTDRLRFFKIYLSMNPDIQKKSLKLISKILSKTNSRVQRKQQVWSTESDA